jgi:hypothetical protein
MHIYLPKVFIYVSPEPKHNRPAGDPTPIAEYSSLSSRITLNERSRSPKEAYSTSPLWASSSRSLFTSFFSLYYLTFVHPQPCLIPSAELYGFLLIYPYPYPIACLLFHTPASSDRLLASSFARFLALTEHPASRGAYTPITPSTCAEQCSAW